MRRTTTTDPVGTDGFERPGPTGDSTNQGFEGGLPATRVVSSWYH